MIQSGLVDSLIEEKRNGIPFLPPTSNLQPPAAEGPPLSFQLLRLLNDGLSLFQCIQYLVGGFRDRRSRPEYSGSAAII